MADRNIPKTVARLSYLYRMLSNSRTKNGYYKAIEADKEPCYRTYKWIDEYNEIRETDRVSWVAFCKANGSSVDHEALDIFA